jgi:ribosomal protein S18 acetylase RimI-like enzyme
LQGGALTVSVLDNPAWWALAGPQRALGTTAPTAARFDPEISPFGALGHRATRAHWDDLAELCGPGGGVALVTLGEDDLRPPDGWVLHRVLPGVQMIGDHFRPRLEATASATGTPTASTPIDPIEALGPEDVPDMLELVARTQPGPFLHRTVEFGGYLGIRRRERLVAMAGERLRPPGYTEISAVATDPDHRKQGLAERLVREVATGIVARSEVPFLHAAASNAGAIRLYESMGFTMRRTVIFQILQAPGA